MLAVVTSVVNILVTLSALLCSRTDNVMHSMGIFLTVLAKAKFFYLSVWFLLVTH